MHNILEIYRVLQLTSYTVVEKMKTCEQTSKAFPRDSIAIQLAYTARQSRRDFMTKLLRRLQFVVTNKLSSAPAALKLRFISL